jgi:hypothetical protein
MPYDIKKRVFWKGDKPKKTTLSLTTTMYKALEDLAKATGESIPDIICKSLEVFLVEMVKQGLIQAPKGEESTIRDLLASLPKS